MPPVRRSQRHEQRLSDFFPPVDALSPIAPKDESLRKSPRKTTSTPAPTKKTTTRKKKKTRTVQSTPVFDPDQSFSEAEADTSAEEEFIKSMRFSPIKATTTQTPTPTTPATPATRGHVRDYEVMVDYQSDSDGFAFSPVKFTPASVKLAHGRKIKGTPMPGKLKEVSKMVWNSATKRVEERVAKSYQSSPLKRPISSGSEASIRGLEQVEATATEEATEAASDLEGDSASSESDDDAVEATTEIVPSNQTMTTECDQSNEQPDAQAGKMVSPAASKTSRSRRATSITDAVTSDQTPLIAASSDQTQQFEDAEEFPRPTYRPRSSMLSKARRTTTISEATTRSPPVRLTRAVSGSMPLQKLETLALPEYILNPDDNTRPKRKAHARLPKKIPVTVPKPFHLSKAKSKAEPEMTDYASEKENVIEEEQATTLPRQSTSSNVAMTKKRKADGAPEQVFGLQSPAKRIKVQDVDRPIAPIRRKLVVTKPRSTISSFAFSSDAYLKQRTLQRELKLRQEAEDEARTRRGVSDAGRVPHSLYSPEKLQYPSQRAATPTKPQPFKFSTDARAARSPLVKTPVAVAATKTKAVERMRVPALEVAPFVPKPSMLPVTLAASPIRQLPSRIETRREFDRVAERHAEEVMQKRKREEELLAAERERKIEERKGWKSQGMAAIESWAARAKVTSDGKRDWID